MPKSEETNLHPLDAISLAIIVLKVTGWLPITWPQALALPAFLFLSGVIIGVAEAFGKQEPEEKGTTMKGILERLKNNENQRTGNMK